MAGVYTGVYIALYMAGVYIALIRYANDNTVVSCQLLSVLSVEMLSIVSSVQGASGCAGEYSGPRGMADGGGESATFS